jgi:hypothetical protein
VAGSMPAVEGPARDLERRRSAMRGGGNLQADRNIRKVTCKGGPCRIRGFGWLKSRAVCSTL